MSVVSDTSSVNHPSHLKEIRSSTLRFQKSLRESAAPFQGICTLRESGNLVTYDEKAIRLWNLQQQIKALHLEKNDLEKWKFVHLNALDEIDCFLVLYSIKKSAGEEKGGCMRIFSSNLQLLQEIDIKLPAIEKVVFANNQSDIVLLGMTLFFLKFTMELCF